VKIDLNKVCDTKYKRKNAIVGEKICKEEKKKISALSMKQKKRNYSRTGE